MLNPLDEWKPEHRAGLLVASAGGAALGVAVGFWTRSCSRLTGDGLAHIIGCPSFTQWAGNPEEMIFWALVGAIVGEAAIYCFRRYAAGPSTRASTWQIDPGQRQDGRRRAALPSTRASTWRIDPGQRHDGPPASGRETAAASATAST